MTTPQGQPTAAVAVAVAPPPPSSATSAASTGAPASAPAAVKQAYRLKSVSFQSTPRKILLQNENGPCPLLAAANALLLRGVITLPSHCIRNGVASIDDVVNVLAERAVSRSGQHDDASALTNSEKAAADAGSAGKSGGGGGWIEVLSGVGRYAKDGTKTGTKSSDATKAAATTKGANHAQPSISSAADHSDHDNDATLHVQHHLHEVLSLLPNLQYGMDVNPKFTFGPTGVEFTTNLTAFDLLGVELVHGWLLDPQDVETASLVEGRSYNELVELVIRGNEAAAEVEKLAKEIEEKERTLEEIEEGEGSAVRDDEAGTEEKKEVEGAAVADATRKEGRSVVEKAGDDAAGWVNVPEASAQVGGGGAGNKKSSGDDETDGDGEDAVKVVLDEFLDQVCAGTAAAASVGKEPTATAVNSSAAAKSSDDAKEEASSTLPSSSPTTATTLRSELSTLRERYHSQSTLAASGHVVNSFLTSTSHQLTYHGLHELHNHVSEQTLCVFFRNNHFATLTKHDGVLYLLVTDLGYANVPEVVWEKLDAIDGDTTYVDEYFVKPEPRETLGVAAGPALSPEQLLAQSGRSEADYQLALQLSKQQEGGSNAVKKAGKAESRQSQQARMDEEEGRLMAAATEASLREWNESKHGAASNHASAASASTSASSTSASAPQHHVATAGDGSTPSSSAPPAVGVPVDPSLIQSDEAVAKALQAQMEADHRSEELARRLQAEEERLARAAAASTSANNNNSANNRRRNNARTAAAARQGASSSGGADKSNCVVS